MVIKNPTPKQVALLVSASVCLGLLVLLLCINLFSSSSISANTMIFIVVGGFLIAYMTVMYFLREYIYRKIKLIYKNIHNYKLSPDDRSNKLDMSDHIIDKVEEEVVLWAEDQAEEIHKLKEWQEYRRRFLGDISHELKTPIFNIQGYLETLVDGGLDDPTISSSYVSRALKNVNRLNTIVEDLDSISKLESGTMVLDIQDFDIKILAQEVLEEMEFKAERKNISLDFKVGADNSRMVQADRETIRQVLTNLVTNSIKYGKEGGSTKIGLYDMDKNLLIEVSDDGIGMSEEDLERIFDRFYRVDKSRSRKNGGSGLGLAIVKHIIEAHHQTINVRSSPGLGSTFGFTLLKKV